MAIRSYRFRSQQPIRYLMQKIDLNAPPHLLIWPVLRANSWPLLSTSIMLTGANLAPDLIPDPEGVAPPEAFELATWVVVMLAWVLADTSIAFAVYPTLLTGGVLSGYEALRRAAFPRMALFAVMQFLLMIVTFVVLVAMVSLLLAVGVGQPDTVFDNPWLPVASIATLLALFLLGLALPDIVMTGRLALGQVLRWTWRWRGALAVGLLAGTAPLYWASEALMSRATLIAPGEAATGVTFEFVALTYASVGLSLLGTVMAAIVFARIYRAELPPDVLLEAGRVSEVFD